MKTRAHRLGLILGIASITGIALMPLSASAQEPAPPPAPAAPAPNAGQTPDFAKVRGMVREMVELKRAGKEDEANRMAERIKAETNHHPRVVAMLERHKKGDAPRARGDGAPESRPAARERENRPKAGAAAVDGNPVARLRHLRVAAAHLEAAGVKGLAESVRAQIAQMESRAQTRGKAPQASGQACPLLDRPGVNPQPMRFGQPPRRPLAAPQSGFGVPPAQRREGFQSPRPQAPGGQAPAGDANSALLEEIRKLRSEMGELRGQVKQLQSNPARPQRPLRDVPGNPPVQPQAR